jgi:hypothetical protein
MAPRFKIVMSSGSKKRTQIWFPFLLKRPGKRIPSRFPNGAPIKRGTSLQGVFTYLFISKTLRKERSPCSPKAGPLWKHTPIPEPYLAYLSGSPVKEPSPEAVRTDSRKRETLYS